MTIEQETKPLANQDKLKSFQGSTTLRQRLLTFVVPTILIPLIIAGITGQVITERKTKAKVYRDLQQNSYLATNGFLMFIQESKNINDLILANPISVRGLRQANQKTLDENLSLISIEEMEEKFKQNKLLIPNQELNQYLEYLVQNSNITEIIVTERNGFNVGYSSMTSDFVQRDEYWWRTALLKKQVIEEPTYDQSTDTEVVAISQEIKDPDTGIFLGVIKTTFPTTWMQNNIASYFTDALATSETIQIFDTNSGNTISTINFSGYDPENKTLVGGEVISGIAQTIVTSVNTNRSLEELQAIIKQTYGLPAIKVQRKNVLSQLSTFVQLEYQDKVYYFSTIPDTRLITVSSIDQSEIAQLGNDLLKSFAVITLILSIIAIITVALLAQQLSRPLTNLSETTQKVAAGNLELEAEVTGTSETRTLANNFNNLVRQIKESLQIQQNFAEEQRQEKEKLEMAIYTLIEEISEATEGDLTVRANLDSLELSTVADLFNAIIDNLQEIAIEAKESSGIVGSSLKENEQAIRTLAEQAIAEAQETRNTLMSIEQMSQSIRAVADNARQAETITDDTYQTVLQSTENMDLTVNSILELRNTVGETAKKMKRLGDSSQKISQAVSLIEEIALKTNVLAINASAEAERAGEYGQGFSIVAQQVGSLAKQSATASQEVAKIVAAIQVETQEVSQAMQSGTAQVTNSTRLVESTKNSLGQILEKSREINQLMNSISQTTVSQANTSQNVTSLMQKIAQLSEISSQSSEKVAQSIMETVQVAQKLESTVAQFKVAK